MRDEFAATLLRLATEDQRVMLLTADLGFGVFEPFIERLPRQYLNVGVAEQNLIGVATGLALEGHIVFAYSIGNFPVLRCLEQIRNDAAYHDASVKVVSVGAGFSYGPLGMSHHATEDIAVLRAIPDVQIYVPGTRTEVVDATLALHSTPGAGYLRLDKSVAQEPPAPAPLRVDQWRVFRDGSDVTILAAGGILGEALVAATVLEAQGISVRVVSAMRLAPCSRHQVLDSVGSSPLVVTLEEHVVRGGLGGLVAEYLVEARDRPVLLRLGVEGSFVSLVGSQAYLRSMVGIDADGIVRAIIAALRTAGSRI